VKVAVVGAGIAGLSAAWELTSGPDPAEVTVFEPDRPGGKIQTVDFCGHRVDTGPDAMITRSPEGIRLCEELGLGCELVAPAANRALIWSSGRLRPLPEGLVLGVPGRLGPVAASRLLSPVGVARAGLDLVLPRENNHGDVSVHELVSRRFGRQVAERLVEPLLGSIHAGRTDHLSVAATAPQLAQAVKDHRSLLLGLRHLPGPGAGPIFLGLRGGMARLVDRLIEALGERGVTFVSTPVTDLRGERGGVIVEPDGPFNHAVLATPAAVSARLLKDASPEASTALASIRAASVVLVTLAYPRESIRIPGDASGVLVPPEEGRLMTACSFGSQKWPHWSDPDLMVLRVSAGRDGDTRALALDDHVLVERLHDELSTALEIRSAPVGRRVTRWPESFPQFDVGHLDRVDQLDKVVARDIPSVTLAGASYRGSGVPACIASGRRAAQGAIVRTGTR
jgi:oxygen-dependent protoporphyrinogen oxidase